MTLPLAFPALHASHGGIYLREPGGETRAVSKGEAVGRAAETPVIFMNAPLMGQRLGYPDLSGLDLLELWAFVHPARFVVPTPKGMARALDLSSRPGEGRGDELGEADIPALYHAAAGALLAILESPEWAEREGAWTSAQSLYRLRWPWAQLVVPRLKKPERAERWLFSKLPEWEEKSARGQPRTVSLDADEVAQRLGRLTGEGAEQRLGQRAYAEAAAACFAPRAYRDQPNLLLAEAGTGIGKTLGYLTPASLWAEKADGAVWISTYTKALQRQLDRETQRIFPDPAMLRRKVVIRKGRENYLCLLNLEDALQGGFAGRAAVLAHLVARWAAFSKDGDMVGGDLPGWLPTLFRRNGSTALTDRRGECVYAGCPHYRKCFIERAARASADADLVIANHALVMVQAAMGGLDDATRPLRYVFDEGHHLFDAADGAFAAHLSGIEASDLRRWLLGAEGRRGSRARGLERRLSDLLGDDLEAHKALRRLLDLAQQLPSSNWQTRLVDGTVLGPAEEFLALVRQQVRARASGEDQGFGQECDVRPLNPGLLEAADRLGQALEQMLAPVRRLRQALRTKLESEADKLDSGQRGRIEGVARSLANRCELTLEAWRAMLRGLHNEPNPAFVDWFAVEKSQNREIDVGMYRHYLDPTEPFVNSVIVPSHGAVITSATLRDSLGVPAAANDELAESLADWMVAEARTGTRHLQAPAIRAAMASPFDYAQATRVLIVRDVKRDDADQVAAAYRELFLAADGGALGLFTAIGRLRAVHQRIAPALEEAGLPLYAQHVGGMDAATLVDIFRAEEHSCLLGTDAVRDGVDVPGRSLRLIVFDRVPWPRPDILHRARKASWKEAGAGANAYDDMLARLRLKQAYGRLIRRADDRGVFVMLDSRLPSRLLGAFPPGVAVDRVGLAEAVAAVKAFLGTT